MASCLMMPVSPFLTINNLADLMTLNWIHREEEILDL